jgi:cardiolipin synthase
MFKYRNIPNLLTFLRVLMIPIIILSFYFHQYYYMRKVTAILFLIASITDFLDGYIARKYNFESNLGAMLDHIADKILVSSVLLMLVKFNLASEIPCIIILARELIISGLREFAANRNLTVSVSNLAKIKTAIQMIAILMIINHDSTQGFYLDHLTQGLLWLAALFSVVTSISYIRFILHNIDCTK